MTTCRLFGTKPLPELIGHSKKHLLVNQNTNLSVHENTFGENAGKMPAMCSCLNMSMRIYLPWSFIVMWNNVPPLLPNTSFLVDGVREAIFPVSKETKFHKIPVSRVPGFTASSCWQISNRFHNGTWSKQYIATWPRGHEGRFFAYQQALNKKSNFIDPLIMARLTKISYQHWSFLWRRYLGSRQLREITQNSFWIMARVSNYIHVKQWDTITHRWLISTAVN